jgi:YcxB-like protein
VTTSSIDLEFDYTFPEVAEAAFEHASSRLASYVMIPFPVLSLLFLISIQVWGYWRDGTIVPSTFWLTCIFPILAPSMYLFQVYVMWRNSAYLRKHIKCILTDRDFAFETPDFKQTRALQSNQRLCEIGDLFLLYFNKYSYFTIPKRSFSDEQQINDFRRLIQSKSEFI